MASRMYRQGQWWEAIRLANSDVVDEAGNVPVGAEVYLPTLDEARQLMDAAAHGAERATLVTMAVEQVPLAGSDPTELQAGETQAVEAAPPARWLANVADPLRGLAEGLLADLRTGPGGRSFITDGVPTGRPLELAVSDYLRRSHGADGVRVLSRVTPGQLHRASVALATEFVSARAPNLDAAARHEAVTEVGRLLRARLADHAYRSVIERTVSDVVARAESYAGVLSRLQSRGGAEAAVERLARARSRGEATEAAVTSALAGYGLGAERAAAWARRITRLEPEQQARLTQELRSGGRRLVRALREHLTRPLQRSRHTSEERLAVLRTFGPALQQARDELGYRAEVAPGRASFAAAACDVYAAHDQATARWNRRVESLCQAGCSAALLPALGIGTLPAVAAGVVVAATRAGLQSGDGAVTRAELGQLLGMTSEADVRAAQAAERARTATSVVGVATAAIPGDVGDVASELVSIVGATAEEDAARGARAGSRADRSTAAPADRAQEYLIVQP